MNGKPEKAVRLVDRKAEKVREVNKVINRTFQKRTSGPKASEWSFVPEGYVEFVRLCGHVLFIPVVLIMAVLEGIRAGFVGALDKARQFYC